MPQKYRIKMRGACSDPLLTKYFFCPEVIRRDWNGTQDGRFYSKKDALACLYNCYNHYLSRYEAGLDGNKPMWTGEIMFYNLAFFYIEKANDK